MFRNERAISSRDEWTMFNESPTLFGAMELTTGWRRTYTCDHSRPVGDHTLSKNTFTG